MIFLDDFEGVHNRTSQERVITCITRWSVELISMLRQWLHEIEGMRYIPLCLSHKVLY